ncbi:hypothetical protein DFP72DRAFT_840269 [Ephemerocybe angulata]|uniref:DUF6534 domain-containing protein n=1 Tax=Ephemerocybe angulata TaxID=980116 RepID=A0A8H6MGT4_9AGAR|nr:hypothetical protein DFP72DRAFT_840269 [Tulosesus angulatus]
MAPISTPVSPIPYCGPILIGALVAYFLNGPVSRPASTICARHRPKRTESTPKRLHGGPWFLGFVHPENLVTQAVEAPATLVLNGAVFFAWRIYALSEDLKVMKFIPVLIIALTLVQFGASIGIAAGWLCLTIPVDTVQQQWDATPTKLRLKEKTLMVLHLITNVVADTIIASSMIALLTRYRQKTVFRPTRGLLQTLTLNTVENGVILTAFAAGNLAVCLSDAVGLAGVTFQYVIGGVYANVLLASLNRRENHRKSTLTDARFNSNAFALSVGSFVAPAASRSTGTCGTDGTSTTETGPTVNIVVTRECDAKVDPVLLTGADSRFSSKGELENRTDQ